MGRRPAIAFACGQALLPRMPHARGNGGIIIGRKANKSKTYPPWNFHKKMQQPGLSHFFLPKTGGFSTWLTRTPHFLQRLPGSRFFKREHFEGQ